jgi:ChpA-C
MNSWAKWTAKTVLVTTAFAAAGGGFAGVALAGTGGTNAGNVAILDGYQVSVPVSVPIDICGNAAAVLGIAAAGCQGGAEVLAHRGPIGRPPAPTRGLPARNISAGAGNTFQVPVKVAAKIKQAGLSAGSLSAGNGSVGNGSVGSGDRVPVAVAANVCGNAVAVLGDSNAGCEGGATVGGPGHGRAGRKHELSSVQLAGLGTLPGLANLPTLAGFTNLPLLQGLAGGRSLLPASALSALTSNVGGGMSGDSFATLAIGALLAGAAALKLAGRRSKARKSGAGEVSA